MSSHLISPSPSKSKCSITAINSESGPATPKVLMALLNSSSPSSPDLSASQSRKQCLKILNSVPPLAMAILRRALRSFSMKETTEEGRCFEPGRRRPLYWAFSSWAMLAWVCFS